MKELKALNKLRTNLLKFSVSKDETRLHLNSIWHDDKLGALVSTNGHHATILRSRYSPELSDKLIDPVTYQLINRDAVKIAAVVPSKYKTKLTYTIETHHFSKMIKGRPTITHFFEDGSISIGGNSSEWGAGKTRLFSINAAFLKHLVGRSYHVGINADLSPVSFALDNEELGLANDIFLIMPLKV